MLDTIEGFCKNYEHIINALTAVGTCAAVIVSLYIARNSIKPKLKAYVYNSIIIHDSIPENERPKFLSVNITNTGLPVIRIPFAYFNWKIPFSRGMAFVTPYDYSAQDIWVPQRQYPYKLEPFCAESFFVGSKTVFNREMKKIFKRFTRFRTLRAYFIRVIIITDNGAKFRAKISKEVRQELLKIAATCEN